METTRIALYGHPGNRDGTTGKDQLYKNVYLESMAQGSPVEKVAYKAVKRPGMSQHLTDTAGAGRGMYGWKDKLYSIIGNDLYKDGVLIEGSLTNSTGLVSFTEQAVADLLIIKDGDKLITVTTGDAVTELTDEHIPTSLVQGVVSLDTYIFVMNTTGEIYNSAADNVESWPESAFISNTAEADDGVALAKHRNYVMALNEWTTQFFYDAALITAPLARVEGATHHIGCAAADTVWSDEDTVVWLSQTRSGGPKLSMMEGAQIKTVSIPAVDRILEKEEATLNTARGYAMRIAGHLFYILTLPTTDITLVYDMSMSMWYEWNTDTGSSENKFTCISHASINDKQYLLDEDNGKIYEMDLDKYQDDGQDINVEIRTDPKDFGASTNKFCSRATIVCDRQTSTSALTVDWTDDDYITYSTARSVDMNKINPSMYAMGRFQSRAFRIKHVANTPLRIEGIELAIDMGYYEGGNR